MSGRSPIYTQLRELIERTCELYEDVLRDGVPTPEQRDAIAAHNRRTLGLAEEHEFTARLAIGLLHGGYTRRTHYAARQYDVLYGTGELTEWLDNERRPDRGNDPSAA